MSWDCFDEKFMVVMPALSTMGGACMYIVRRSLVRGWIVDCEYIHVM